LVEDKWFVLCVAAFAAAVAAAQGLAQLRLTRRLADQQARWNRRQQAMQSELGALRGQIAELQSGLEECRRRGNAGSPAASMTALNLTRRVQAIRLSRRGDSPGEIAAALGIPQGEVELLLKVRQMASETGGR